VNLDSRFGRIMYGISLLVSVGMLAFVWLVLQPSLIFSIVFTVFVVGIAMWNGRSAFGVSSKTPRT